MTRRCVAVGRVVAGRPIIERVDTSQYNLVMSQAVDLGRAQVAAIAEADGDCPECGSVLDATGRCSNITRHGGDYGNS
jgi:hypothetical protein